MPLTPEAFPTYGTWEIAYAVWGQPEIPSDIPLGQIAIFSSVCLGTFYRPTQIVPNNFLNYSISLRV